MMMMMMIQRRRIQYRYQHYTICILFAALACQEVSAFSVASNIFFPSRQQHGHAKTTTTPNLGDHDAGIRVLTNTKTVVLWAKPKSKQGVGSVGRRGGSGGGGGGGKSSKAGSKFVNNRSSSGPTTTTTRTTATATATTATPQKKNPTNKNNKNPSSNSPPWKVMSASEAKKNIEKEKERRERARQGILDNHTDAAATVTLSKAFLSAADQRFLKWKRFNPFTVPNGMRYVGSYLNKRLPESLGVPEVAFLGRSNVGKSSLLNKLASTSSSTSSSSSLGSFQSARVGKTPGATASVNLYALTTSANNKYKTLSSSSSNKNKSSNNSNNNNSKDILGFVDLPGFGYAKLSKEVQESVQQAAEQYLEKRRELALGILLVDVRRCPPSDDDKAVLAALYDMGLPLLVVATKMDKISSKQEQERHLQQINQGLGLPIGQPLAVSSVTGEGIKLLWSIILEACETSVAEFKAKYQDEKERAKQQEEEDEEEEEKVVEAGPVVLSSNDPAQVLYNNDYDDDDEDLTYDQGYDWIHGSNYLDDNHNDNAPLTAIKSRDDHHYGEEWYNYEDDFFPKSSSLSSSKNSRSLPQRAKKREPRDEEI